MVSGSSARCAVLLLTMLPLLAAAGSLRSGYASTNLASGDGDEAVKMMAKRDKDEMEKDMQKFQTPMAKSEQTTWWFWKPLVCSMAFLLIMTDLIGKACDCCLNHGLIKEGALFLLTMIGFAAVVFLVLDWKAGGMQTLVGAAVLGLAIAILFFAISLSIVAFTTDPIDPVKMLLSDLSHGLRGLVRVIMLCTLVDVISHVAGVDWARLVLVLAFLLLALGLALAGVIGDLMAHIFIRFDRFFKEGEFILFDGGLVQIKELHWRTTVGLSNDTQSVIYIPNNALVSSALVNKTLDVTEQLKLADEELLKLKIEK